jgi:DNA-binding NarL/FixJ family response regulator
MTGILASSATALRIALVEDDPHLRGLLHEYLHAQPEFECVAVADSMEELLSELALCLPPNVILVDLNLPGMGGLEALPLLRQRHPDAQIIVQTMHDDADRIFQALRAGASGYLIKIATSLVQYKQAIIDVVTGGAAISPSVARKMLAHFTPVPQQQADLLSDREREVLSGLVDGLTEKQIAARLTLGPATVHTYVRRLYEKLRIRSKSELIGRASRGEL